jgi:phage tail sheath protein FI
MPHRIAPRIEAVSTSTAGLVGGAGQGPSDQAVLVTSLSEFQGVFGGPQPGQDLFLGVDQFFENGGRLAWVVRLGGRGLPNVRRGLAALDDVDDLNLLSLPGLATGRILAEGAAYARGRRAFFLGDPAASRSATLEAVRAIHAADAGHAAVYFPRLRVPDPLQPSATRLAGPAASVAGLLARTDRERGVWAVAAGTTAHVAGAVGLASAVDDRAAATLRARGINAIREAPGHGIVVWGARSVGGETDEWKYIPIRRLALFIEESVYRGLEWTVLEPNDEPTWKLARRQVEAFLGELYRQGAFAGATPESSFFVRCGEDTMTQNDLNQGTLIVEVGIAPLRPAEFVIFRIQRKRP